jgi:hypothetical protein
MYRIIPYWHISVPRLRKNINAVIDAEWEFDYIAGNKPVIVADRNITTSLIKEINDDSLAGKNISM